MDTDIVIIGAGVLGISLGYHLAARGIDAVILESEQVPATHASGKNAGMIRQLYRNSQLTAWTRRSIELWPAEVREHYFRQTGSLIVGRTPPDHHEALFEEVTFLSPQGALPAVLTRTDGLLDSSGYVNYLHRTTDKRRVKALFRRRVTAISPRAGGWQVTTAGGEVVNARRMVNAAGAWVNRFLGAGGCSQLAVPAQAFARHLFLVEGWEADYMPAADCGFFWDEKNGWYMRRWDVSTRLVSVCDRLPADPDTFAPDAGAAEAAARALLAALPDRHSSRLSIARSWHCFRTYTPDQLPIWGPDPAAEGLFWLACFGGFGMSTSYAACLDAADWLAGKPVEIEPSVGISRIRAAAGDHNLPRLRENAPGSGAVST